MARNVDPSPLTELAAALSGASSLANVCKVIAGAKGLAALGAPPRIVLYPDTGRRAGREDAVDDLAAMSLDVVAVCWDVDLDHAWDLRDRLFQAIDEQAADAGVYVEIADGDEKWDSEPDTTQQGQALAVTFTARVQIKRAPLGVGLVSDYQLTPEE